VGQPVFLVECYTSPATAECAAQLLAHLGASAGEGAVTPVSCIAVPADEMCLCVVESDSAELVQEALSRIAVGHERIIGAIQVSPVRGVGA
jgi:hypothetical protein